MTSETEFDAPLTVDQVRCQGCSAATGDSDLCARCDRFFCEDCIEVGVVCEHCFHTKSFVCKNCASDLELAIGVCEDHLDAEARRLKDNNDQLHRKQNTAIKTLLETEELIERPTGGIIGYAGQVGRAIGIARAARLELR